MRILVALVLSVLSVVTTGCSDQAASRVSPADAFVRQVAKLDLDPQNHASYNVYYQMTGQHIAQLLSGLASVPDLKQTFWLCHAKWASRGPTAQDRLQWLDPYFESLNLIMYELAERKDLASTALLVDLYCDPNVAWDAGAALLASDAVVRCGKLALPYLRAKKGGPRDVERLIQLIESGASTAI